MENSPKKFRRTTKVNQKSKIGVFSSGVFLFLGVGILIFFLVVYLVGSLIKAWILALFVVASLLVAAGSDPYKFVRSLSNAKKKPRWKWGRHPSRSLLVSQKTFLSQKSKVKSNAH